MPAYHRTVLLLATVAALPAMAQNTAPKPAGEQVIVPRVERIVANIEKTCRAIIQSKGTLFSVFNVTLPKRG